MTWINKLNVMAVGVAAVIFAACGIALFAPNSEIACTIERFQTLFTGSVAGLAALITAGIVYRAAKEPIENEKLRLEEHKSAMRTAGAAVITTAVDSIYVAILHKAGKPANKRGGELVVPSALLDLEVISTQDNDIVKEFSEFIYLASRYDAYVGLTDPADIAAEDEDRKFLANKLEEIKKVKSSLEEKLEYVAKGGGK